MTLDHLWDYLLFLVQVGGNILQYEISDADKEQQYSVSVYRHC